MQLEGRCPKLLKTLLHLLLLPLLLPLLLLHHSSSLRLHKGRPYCSSTWTESSSSKSCTTAQHFFHLGRGKLMQDLPPHLFLFKQRIVVVKVPGGLPSLLQ